MNQEQNTPPVASFTSEQAAHTLGTTVDDIRIVESSMLRLARLQKNLSQQRYGRIVEVAQSTVGRWEKGLVDIPQYAWPVLLDEGNKRQYWVGGRYLPPSTFFEPIGVGYFAGLPSWSPLRLAPSNQLDPLPPYQLPFVRDTIPDADSGQPHLFPPRFHWFTGNAQSLSSYLQRIEAGKVRHEVLLSGVRVELLPSTPWNTDYQRSLTVRRATDEAGLATVWFAPKWRFMPAVQLSIGGLAFDLGIHLQLRQLLFPDQPLTLSRVDLNVDIDVDITELIVIDSRTRGMRCALALMSHEVFTGARLELRTNWHGLGSPRGARRVRVYDRRDNRGHAEWQRRVLHKRRPAPEVLPRDDLRRARFEMTLRTGKLVGKEKPTTTRGVVEHFSALARGVPPIWLPASVRARLPIGVALACSGVARLGYDRRPLASRGAEKADTPHGLPRGAPGLDLGGAFEEQLRRPALGQGRRPLPNSRVEEEMKRFAASMRSVFGGMAHGFGLPIAAAIQEHEAALAAELERLVRGR